MGIINQLMLAIKLFKDETITLEKAVKLAGLEMENFIEKLGELGIPAVNYSADELKKELKDFD